ncbi:hypothetical protein ATO11_07220 [Pseudaestuariivita atlantica]|uniref:Uncharacterized protein n=2 Tax=Pseudaestuariivita atlantica TaxID=1317121 RepID=A0A0L1JQM9_9RHOB|nr:hypothetical protein ATO11_07220 [Pseudaestuariivita atlantica]
MGLAAPAAADPNTLQQMMLFRSAVQDSDACRVTVEGGVPVFDESVAGAAAATCPDAFAWTQFTTAIREEFWNWSMDQTIWVGEPWGLCTAGETKDCCDPNAPIDPSDPNPNCPTFRADYSPIPTLPAEPNGTPSEQVLNDHGAQLNIADRLDPGRLLRDLELELVFRNRAMFDYIYRNDMYSREGLASHNRAQNKALSDGDIGAAQRMTVRLPVDAVMVKADFIHLEIMQSLGLVQDLGDGGPPNHPEYPFLTVFIENYDEGQVPGVYYMMAMTNASKDIPVWHWYAMEHVMNPGRCDYIGCNDSFGYKVNGKMQEGADFGDHYIPPMIVLNDDKTKHNDPLFVTGEVYHPEMTGERPSDQLSALFEGMGVGVDEVDRDWQVITPGDPQWKNYRLKGTQSSFTTAAGIPTGTGATLTEGGFVNSASCATCHSQSSVDSQGFSGVQGVGATWRPNLLGYGQVAMGAPDGQWFYNFGGPSITATQMDFIWGILGASCVNPGATHGDPCTSYYDTPRKVE